MPRAQMTAHVPAVGTGQHQVEQHQVPALPVDRRHRTQPVGLAVQAVTGLLQVQAQGGRDGVVVFDQQQLFVHRASGEAQKWLHRHDWNRDGFAQPQVGPKVV